MSEVKNMKVEFVDKDHIFVDNQQFISLKYYAKRLNSSAEYTVNEVKILSDKLNELAKENEALRVLLKKQLNDVKDSSSTETFVNKVCASEKDHEWECCGISTEGTDFRCKNCGAHKTVLSDYHPLSVTI